MKNVFLTLWLLALSSCLPLSVAAFASELDVLAKEFADPPRTARPWVYWFIMDGNLSREGITADLEAMEAAGIGGVIIMEVNVGIPRGDVEFMSDAWCALFKHAVRRGGATGTADYAQRRTWLDRQWRSLGQGRAVDAASGGQQRGGHRSIASSTRYCRALRLVSLTSAVPDCQCVAAGARKISTRRGGAGGSDYHATNVRLRGCGREGALRARTVFLQTGRETVPSGPRIVCATCHADAVIPCATRLSI